MALPLVAELKVTVLVSIVSAIVPVPTALKLVVLPLLILAFSVNVSLPS